MEPLRYAAHADVQLHTFYSSLSCEVSYSNADNNQRPLYVIYGAFTTEGTHFLFDTVFRKGWVRMWLLMVFVNTNS